MAENLGIKRCWFHKNHYDIPKLRIDEIMEQCEWFTTKQIVNIIKNSKANENDDIGSLLSPTDSY